jgi:hypothetical protein
MIEAAATVSTEIYATLTKGSSEEAIASPETLPSATLSANV